MNEDREPSKIMKKRTFLYFVQQKRYNDIKEIYRNQLYDQNNAVGKLFLYPNSDRHQ